MKKLQHKEREFKHFTLKEIFEQPETIRNAIKGRLMVSEGTAHLKEYAGAGRGYDVDKPRNLAKSVTVE